MAAIFTSNCLVGKNHVIKKHKNTSTPGSLIPLSLQTSKPSGEEDLSATTRKGEKPSSGIQALSRVSELGKRLQENLSPKQKGDWKDVVLMSLSFGVYVYISQKIVCAYCAWMSMLK
ncbi:unnamed protein product [Amaranthus hypochondriacus]